MRKLLHEKQEIFKIALIIMQKLIVQFDITYWVKELIVQFDITYPLFVRKRLYARARNAAEFNYFFHILKDYFRLTLILFDIKKAQPNLLS